MTFTKFMSWTQFGTGSMATHVLYPLPLDGHKLHGRTGQSHNRWLPRQMLKDLHFLVECMITSVKERGKYAELSVTTVVDVDVMFQQDFQRISLNTRCAEEVEHGGS